MKDMTEGKPYRLILVFMIPVLFGGLIVQSSLNMLGEVHIAAYSAANKIQNYK